MSGSGGRRRGLKEKGMLLAFIDINRARFHAMAKKDATIKLQADDDEPGTRGMPLDWPASASANVPAVMGSSRLLVRGKRLRLRPRLPELPAPRIARHLLL